MLQVVAKHVTTGEVESISGVLPPELRKLFPEPLLTVAAVG